MKLIGSLIAHKIMFIKHVVEKEKPKKAITLKFEIVEEKKKPITLKVNSNEILSFSSDDNEEMSMLVKEHSIRC